MPDLTVRRGAIPSHRSALAAAVPHSALVGAPPQMIVKPASLSIWGNDVHGDCVTAEEAFAKACHDPEIFISEQDVVNWAKAHGVLEGASLTGVMNSMQSDGFVQGNIRYDDGPYQSVDWTKPAVLQSAISQGPVKLGVAADQIETSWHTTNGQSGWFGTGYHSDQAEDHCVSLCGYGSISWLAGQLGVPVPGGVDGNQPGYALFTWGSIGIIDVPSLLAVTEEAWLRQPTTRTVGTTGWAPDWFPLPGQAVFDKDHQELAAVSRAPGNLDLFVIGNDGHVWSQYWNGAWATDWFPLPGQAVFDKDVQKVAAVSRAPGNLDLFVIGYDSHIWSTYWNDASGWAPDWFPLPGQAVFDMNHQHVAAVSRAPGNLDLFVIGNDGHVWSQYWNGAWAPDWFPLPGGAVFDKDVQQLAAVSRASGNLDLFVIGYDSHIWSTYWNGSWAPDWFPLPGQAVFDMNHQQVAAVSRAPGNLDLFVIGNDGRGWSQYWNGSWAPDWFPLPGRAVFDKDTQRVAAVSRAPGNLDLFVIGNDSHIWSTYWNGNWAPNWFPLPGQAVFDLNHQQVAAVSRADANLDLFVIGNESHGWSQYWSGGS